MVLFSHPLPVYNTNSLLVGFFSFSDLELFRTLHKNRCLFTFSIRYFSWLLEFKTCVHKSGCNCTIEYLDFSFFLFLVKSSELM